MLRVRPLVGSLRVERARGVLREHEQLRGGLCQRWVPDDPEIEFGIHPFGAGNSLATTPSFPSTTVLPLQIKDITNASVALEGLNVSIQKATTWNVDFELWLSQKNACVSTGDLCCVAQGICCVSELAALPRLSFDACADGASPCDLPATEFGSPPGSYLAHSYIPAPSPNQRSGLIMQGALDPGMRLRIAARMQLAAASGCSSCAELVGIGLSAEPGNDQARELTPELSIVASSQLSQVLVAAGAKTLWSAAIDTRAHDYELEHDPNGTTRLRIDGVVRASLLVWLPSTPLKALIFGRSDPGVQAGMHTRLAEAHAGSARCEETAAWPERVALTPADLDARAPSILQQAQGARLLAYESAHAIYLTPWRSADTNVEAGSPALSAGESDFDAAGVADPELALEGDAVELYYTAIARDGTRSLGRALLSLQASSPVLERKQLASPAKLGLRELFGPSVLSVSPKEKYLLATASTTDGTTRLALSRCAGVRLRARHTAPQCR